MRFWSCREVAVTTTTTTFDTVAPFLRISTKRRCRIGKRILGKSPFHYNGRNIYPGTQSDLLHLLVWVVFISLLLSWVRSFKKECRIAVTKVRLTVSRVRFSFSLEGRNFKDFFRSGVCPFCQCFKAFHIFGDKFSRISGSVGILFVWFMNRSRAFPGITKIWWNLNPEVEVERYFKNNNTKKSLKDKAHAYFKTLTWKFFIKLQVSDSISTLYLVIIIAYIVIGLKLPKD